MSSDLTILGIGIIITIYDDKSFDNVYYFNIRGDKLLIAQMFVYNYYWNHTEYKKQNFSEFLDYSSN